MTDRLSHQPLLPHTNLSRAVVIGVGSPHGDDRAGWEVIEGLQAESLPWVELLKAAVPHDILDWLQPVGRLRIVDACQSSEGLGCYRVVADEQGALQIFGMESEQKMPQEMLVAGTALQLRSGSTHQLDLWSVLQLAGALRCLPPDIQLWTIPVNCTDRCAPVGATTAAYVAQCVAQLKRQLLSRHPSTGEPHHA